MRLPPFNAQGDLPSGVHRAMLPQVLERFGHGTPERIIAAEGLQHIITLAQGTRKLVRVFIWGSYITAKPDPGDLDLILVMAPDFVSDDYTAETRSVFDSATAERTLEATIFWMNGGVGTETTEANLLQQFQIRRDGGQRGIVEVVL